VQTHFEGKGFPAVLDVCRRALKEKRFPAVFDVCRRTLKEGSSWSKSAGKKANLTINGGAEGLLLQQ
jgi:hypothetical protein